MKIFVTGVSVIIGILLTVTMLLTLTEVLIRDAVQSVLAGITISFLFVASGYTAFTLALKYRQKEFNKIVGISILVRLLFMAVALGTIFKFTDLEKLPFLIAMFVSYFLLQIWELISFNRLNPERT